MAVLYRKYRPQTFAEVVNQKYIIQTLKNQVAAGKPAHAYLFTGGRGVGKTSVARILAKAVNCEEASSGERLASSKNAGDACGECDVCRQIEQGNFLDLIEIDAASNTGVDNIRDLIEHVKFSPSAGKYKVFIIDEVHMLSKGAFNALLKTLEEPPEHAIFILATTEINKVPATIISRTQRFDFRQLSVEDLEKHLADIVKREKLKLHKEILALISQHAEGSVRDALSLLGKVLTLGPEASLEDSRQLLGVTDAAALQTLLELIAGGQSAGIPDFFEQLSDKGADLLGFNRDFLEYLRSVLVEKVTAGAGQSGLAQQQKEFLRALLPGLSAGDIIFMTRLFLRSFKEIGSSPSADIPLLLAALEAAGRKSGDSNNNNNNQNNIQQPSDFVRPPESVVAPKPAPLVESVLPAPADPLPEISDDIKLDMDEVRAAWPGVIAKINEINSPLANLVRTSPVQKIERGRIVLGVKYSFHKQNIEQQKNAGVIMSALQDLLDKRVGIAAEVIKENPAEVQTAGAAMGEALAIFGGELIE